MSEVIVKIYVILMFHKAWLFKLLHSDHYSDTGWYIGFCSKFWNIKNVVATKKRYFVTAELLVRWTFDRNATIIEQ